jgi:hypothetical protein
MTGKGSAGRAGLAVLALLATPAPAKADAIDGHWCSADGRNLSIQGSKIVTPAGHPTTGDYARHFFTYRVPADEPGAGGVIKMVLRNEQTVDLAREEPGASVETWTRCENVSRLVDGSRLAAR